MDKLTPFATNIAQEKSTSIEKETQKMLTLFRTQQFTGKSQANEVQVTMNGDYEVINVQCDPNQIHRLNTLLTEALIHAFQQIEFDLTSRLDAIDYMFFGEAISAIEKPGQVNNKFKQHLTTQKKH